MAEGGGGGAGGGAGGGGGGGNPYIMAARIAMDMAASGLEVYGQWYSDKQKANYYRNQAELVMEQKKVAANQVAMLYLQSDVLKRQAQDAHQLSLNVRRLNEYGEGKLREAGDTAYSDAYSKMAKSGVAMNYGSPMEMMNKLADDEAEAYGLKVWENKLAAYRADMGAYEADAKSTISLNEANIAKEGLQMYDYQSKLYELAAKEVRKASGLKQWTIALNNASESMARNS